MILQLDQFKASQRYYLMSQTLVPRPVAWVLSENDTGNYNLAPFSYFNAICSAPPLIMLSIGNITFVLSAIGMAWVDNMNKH